MKRALILLLVWITPAIIAGALGWNGIWGSGSAFFDYLIPIPVAGGVFHVPSFVVAAAIILSLKNLPESTAQFVPLAALGVFLLAQTLQLDFDRLNDALFTDYEPFGSAFRFGGNPLLLFVATDALWVAVYALLSGHAAKWPYWLLLPLVPAVLIGVEVLNYKTSGPQFSYGFSAYGKTRGDKITMVYTPNAYDEALFREWLESDTSVNRPWETPNAEHLAVLFTRSMQAIKWRKTDDIENVVGTICIYEEDRSLTSHAGHYDCFADRLTVAEKMAANLESTKTGLGREIDIWFARAALCKGVEVPEDYVSDIAMLTLCRRMTRGYPKILTRITQQFGEESEQVAFLRSNANLFGMADDE